MSFQIERNSRRFCIEATEEYSHWWFQERFPGWEEETFHVLERFLKTDQIYIDMGAWIGPTLLYAASMGICSHGIEPDRVAFLRLQKNLEANPDFKDVYLHSVALTSETGKYTFGGNGELGNSESTLLVNEPSFLKHGGTDPHWCGNNPVWRQGQQAQVEGLSFKDFLEQQAIQIEDVCLIKIDIEGSEKYVIPTLEQALGRARPPIYISLHRVFLQEEELIKCLDILTHLYTGIYNSKLKRLSVSEILETRQEDLLLLSE